MLELRVLQGSECSIGTHTIDCTLGIGLKVALSGWSLMFPSEIIDTSFTNNKITISLITTKDKINGHIKLGLGDIGATYVNKIGQTKEEFQD